MRPRKIILCIDPNTTDLSVLSYTLRINGFRVFSAETEIEALAIFANEEIDLVLCDCTTKVMDGFHAVRWLKGMMRRSIPMILLAKKEQLGLLHPADSMLAKSLSTVELLDRVKVMSARRPGPKLGSKRMPRAVKPEMDEVAVA